ncbi:MAG: hypothetical protein ACI9DE_002737, partial [Halioglobus sp.]
MTGSDKSGSDKSRSNESREHVERFACALDAIDRGICIDGAECDSTE